MSLLDMMLETVPVKSTTECANADRVVDVSVPQDAHNPFARDILFVATNLDSFEADDIRYGYEMMIDVCYRQLDANYYAWLRDKMTQVRNAHKSGKMKPELYDELRERFNIIHSWAVIHIGEQVLLDAVKSFNTGRYTPPSESTFKTYRMREPIPGMPSAGENLVLSEFPMSKTSEYLFPQGDDWSHSVRITQDAQERVAAICDEALKLGWTEAGLYQNRGRYPFPYGQEYGLICFLSSGRTIGEISAQSIEIIGNHPKGERNRFYNPHMVQPWITRTA